MLKEAVTSSQGLLHPPLKLYFSFSHSLQLTGLWFLLGGFVFFFFSFSYLYGNKDLWQHALSRFLFSLAVLDYFPETQTQFILGSTY